MIIFEKNSTIKITYGLSAKEYQCKCKFKECRASFITIRLKTVYKKFRKAVGIALTILSGNRCQRHNFNVGGAKKSRHLDGEGIDIDSDNLLSVFSLEEVKKIAKESGFTYIKYYPNKKFFHLDVRLEV